MASPSASSAVTLPEEAPGEVAEELAARLA
jgi:hypothetical protein